MATPWVTNTTMGFMAVSHSKRGTGGPPVLVEKEHGQAARAPLSTPGYPLKSHRDLWIQILALPKAGMEWAVGPENPAHEIENVPNHFPPRSGTVNPPFLVIVLGSRIA